MSRRLEWSGGRGREFRRLSPRPRILVLCEGTKTEPKYFKDWRHETRNAMVSVEIVGEGVVPKTLVERAVKLKRDAEREARRTRDSFQRYDEIWCVFDRDEHPRFHEAMQQAKDNGILLATSNPSFELWLLLHYQKVTAHIERHEVHSRFRHHCPGYEKEAPFQQPPIFLRFCVDSVSRTCELAEPTRVPRT